MGSLVFMSSKVCGVWLRNSETVSWSLGWWSRLAFSRGSSCLRLRHCALKLDSERRTWSRVFFPPNSCHFLLSWSEVCRIFLDKKSLILFSTRLPLMLQSLKQLQASKGDIFPMLLLVSSRHSGPFWLISKNRPRKNNKQAGSLHNETRKGMNESSAPFSLT